MDLQNEIIKAYQVRAKFYSEKTKWVDDQQFLTPFLIEVEGEKKALDVCSGTGAVSKSLSQQGWDTVSLDISDDMMKMGKLTNTVLGSVEAIPFPDNSFDLVTCRQGLQYTDLRTSLCEIMRVAKRKVILGHITTELNDKYSFWKEYFKVASPGRKIIFKPYQVAIEAEKLNYTVEKIEVKRQLDYYRGPLLHLQKDDYNQLIELVKRQSDSFKKLYNIIEDNTEILYSNRWEFITLTK